MSEHVAAQRIVRVCAAARFFWQHSGIPKGRQSWGRFLLVTFLGEARKVTSRRATPGLGTLQALGCILNTRYYYWQPE